MRIIANLNKRFASILPAIYHTMATLRDSLWQWKHYTLSPVSGVS